MNILVVDDQRIFKFFPSLHEPGPEDSVVHVTTSQDAMAELEKDWDEVYLDHDLGMESVGSGWDIVKHILEELPIVGRFYVHTMNPVGMDRMVKALDHHYQVQRLDPSPYLDYDAMYVQQRNPWLAGPRR